MAKLCPQCQKENPSAANVCMFCGTRLVENAEMDKVDALHKELNEAEDTIQLLKKALDVQLKKEKNEKENKKTEEKVELSKIEGKIINKPSINKQLVLFMIVVGILIFGFFGYKIIKLKKTDSITKTESVEAFPNVEKIEKFINNYYSNIQYKRYDELSEMFAFCVDRYFSFNNIDRNTIIKDIKKYNEKFDMYKRHWNIRWSSLEILNKNKDYVQICYLVDYSIEGIDKTKPSNFLIKMNIKLNSDYQIVSIYEVILEQKSNNTPHGIKYKAITKTYFYNFNNGVFEQRKAYLVADDKVTITQQISSFGYTEFVNDKGQTTKGWLKMSDLEEY